MQEKADRSVLRLVELGMCQPSDIEKARNDAKRFSSPDYSAKIRRAERLLGAAGDPTRIKMLLLLASREMCVCELESALGLPQPTASHHLGILEQADLVERSRKERWVFYRARETTTLNLLLDLITK